MYRIYSRRILVRCSYDLAPWAEEQKSTGRLKGIRAVPIKGKNLGCLRKRTAEILSMGALQIGWLAQLVSSWILDIFPSINFSLF